MKKNKLLRNAILFSPLLFAFFITQCGGLPRIGVHNKMLITEGTHVILSPELALVKIGKLKKDILNNSKNPYHFLTTNGNNTMEVRAIYIKNNIFHISAPIQLKTKSAKGDIILLCALITKPDYHYQSGDTMYVELAVKKIKLKPTKNNLIFYERKIEAEVLAKKCPAK